MQSQSQEEQTRVQRVLDTVLTETDKKIYNMIKEHPSSKNDIKKRTNFPPAMIDKILQNLSKYSLIKNVKKPESKNLNIWVLFSAPEEDEQEQHHQDSQDLLALIRKKQEPLSLNELKKDILRKGVKIDLFDQAIEILRLRGEIFLSEGQNDDEKIVKKRTLKTMTSPCIECHLNEICRPNGVVNPKNCLYLHNW